jgi:hypothetical protein
MGLQMKLKVADKPVRCIALGHFGQQDVILTGAGDYGDEEAMLRWRRDPNSVGQNMELGIILDFY